MDKPVDVTREQVWTGHNIRLGDGRYTLASPQVGAAELMAARILQLAGDLLPGPLDGARVLDLACLEGLYGLELAMHGAHVLAIEGRQENAELAAFAAKQLGVDARYEVRVEDVRGLSPETHGTFDIVLCLGILYHLEAADAFQLAKSVYATCERLAIIRTAVGLSGNRSERDGANLYHGFTYSEIGGRWASIGNETSFWPTRPSLLNLLCDVGFTSVLDVAAPPILELDRVEDVAVVACIRGNPLTALAAPEGTDSRFHAARWPENLPAVRSPFQQRGGRVLRSWRDGRFWQRTMRRT